MACGGEGAGGACVERPAMLLRRYLAAQVRVACRGWAQGELQAAHVCGGHGNGLWGGAGGLHVDVEVPSHR